MLKTAKRLIEKHSTQISNFKKMRIKFKHLFRFPHLSRPKIGMLPNALDLDRLVQAHGA